MPLYTLTDVFLCEEGAARPVNLLQEGEVLQREAEAQTPKEFVKQIGYISNEKRTKRIYFMTFDTNKKNRLNLTAENYSVGVIVRKGMEVPFDDDIHFYDTGLTGVSTAWEEDRMKCAIDMKNVGVGPVTVKRRHV